METFEVDLVLAPVDRSDESVEALRYAVGIAAEYDAAVHAVHVLEGDIMEAIGTDDVDETEVAADGEAFVGRVQEIAAEQEVPIVTSTAHGFSVRRKTRHPGSVILDLAEEIDADFVVVPREPVSGEVLERAAEYVLLYASQPVLSV